MKTILITTAILLSSMSITAQEKTQSNRHFWHSITTEASPEAIWAVWTNVPHWKDWDTGLQDASLSGAFTEGAKGKVISLQGRSSKFKLVEVVTGRSYTMKTKLPMGALYVKRSLETTGSSTRFTHEVWFKGLSAGLFARALGAEFRELLPGVVQNVDNIASGL